jgi:hypothetical protein
LPFRSKLSDKCRSICTARGGNFLKQHKGVQGYPFETALHFTTLHTGSGEPYVSSEATRLHS